jgi:hypothetical protein
MSHLRCEFNDFLYAPIADDRNQMSVSVVSALARLDIDPWEEAAQLAELPRKMAIARLAPLITSVVEKLTPQPEAEVVATRLVALLPSPSVLGTRQNDGLPLERLPSYVPLLACLMLGAFLIAVVFFGH